MIDRKNETLVAALVLVSLLFAGVVSAASWGDVGAILSYHELESLDGERFTLNDLKGEVLMINFWASWCKPCLMELPVMDQWNSEFAQMGGRVIAISVDHDRANAGKFADDADLSLDVCHDGPHGLAKKLDLPSLPCTYVLDREGRVEHVTTKATEEELQNLRSVMTRLLASAAEGE